MPSLRRMRIAMGTWVAIEATASSEVLAAQAIEGAFKTLADIAQRMHPARAGSDVARLNAAALDRRTPIDASTLEVLQLARRLNALTEGVFDPCLPHREGRICDLELEGADQDVAWVTCRAPVALDLGGIAKGYAIDCAIGALRRLGCSAGMVNAGGDLRLFGARRESVLLRLGDRSYVPLAMQDTALAVSALDEPRRPAGHRGYYTRGTEPLRARRYAAVLAPTAMNADALTKCVLLASPGIAARCLRELGGQDLGDGFLTGESPESASASPLAAADPDPTIG